MAFSDNYIIMTNKDVWAMVQHSEVFLNEVNDYLDANPDILFEKAEDIITNKWIDGDLPGLIPLEDEMYLFDHHDYDVGRYAPPGNDHALVGRCFEITVKCDTCNKEQSWRNDTTYGGLGTSVNFVDWCEIDGCKGISGIVTKVVLN